MNVDPGFEYLEAFKGGVQQYMMSSNGFISNNNFKSNK